MTDLLYWLLSNSDTIVLSIVSGVTGYGIGRVWGEYKRSTELIDAMIYRTPYKDADMEYAILTVAQLKGLLQHTPSYIQARYQGKFK